MENITLNFGKTQIKRNGKNVYIIAEIGQNHQGNLDLAKEMIKKAKDSGCNCVKFQKSSLEAKFTESALNRSYEGVHSWGKTYGEHKRYLEFSLAQYQELQSYSKSLNIDFAASAMDEVSLDELVSLNMTFIKIGSGDANNFSLLKKASQVGCPLIISTGMQTMTTIKRIVQIMIDANKHDFALLHCVSSYPTRAEHCQLQMITHLRDTFPSLVIGYSGHELGLNVSVAAAMLGAKIIERHFTLDKEQKGSDHKCSLLPMEMAELTKKISCLQLENYPTICDVELFLGKSAEITNALKECKPDKTIQECEMECRTKLGKSLVAAKNLEFGQKIFSEDIVIKVSEPNGIWAEYVDDVIGLEMARDIKKGEPIMWCQVKSTNKIN